ncbi:conserved hypothetical protein [Ricinus communis]|uniref:Uncharacterized protein n=1 Tax=Ricinus communis TaxID=3988 RepID=B9ST67_RICCO|nr:conserved hypothetical protein [Ricinus communis]
MAISEHHQEGEDYSETEGSDYSDSDFEMDPNYSILEDTQSQLSNLSIEKKPKSRERPRRRGLEGHSMSVYNNTCTH